MSNGLPEVVDAWRMVSARRIFQGVLPLARMPRLAQALSAVEGDCQYVLEFGRDTLGVAFLDIQAQAVLPLLCQRSLETFGLPVSVHQRLGLIRDEREEAGLPEGYEAFLLSSEGDLSPADTIEDELILAVPVVPVNPLMALPPDDLVWRDEDDGADAAAQENVQVNPFSVLAGLKKRAD